MQPVEHDSGERVHHCRKGGDRQDVAGDLDRFLVHLPLNTLAAFLRCLGRDFPNVIEHGTSPGRQLAGQ